MEPNYNDIHFCVPEAKGVPFEVSVIFNNIHKPDVTEHGYIRDFPSWINECLQYSKDMGTAWDQAKKLVLKLHTDMFKPPDEPKS
jgi:hypothetical protein